MKVTAVLTQRCNLRCRYCYIDRSAEQMSTETAARLVAWSVARLPPGEVLDFGFFGGEPLLCFPLIEEMVATLRAEQRAHPFPLILSVTTNGTLLDDRHLDFFADNDVAIFFSLDGPQQTHQRYRKGPPGSFDATTAAVKRAADRLDQVAINAVYGPDTFTELPDSVRWLAGFGVPLYLNWDILSDWSDDVLALAPAVFDQVVATYRALFAQGSDVEIHPIVDKALMQLAQGRGIEHRCSMGVRELAVDPQGWLYPCERFAGYAEHVIGSVWDGVDDALLDDALRQHRQPDPTCTDCSLEPFCTNSCGCTNWFMTRDYGRASPTVCALERGLVGALSAHWRPLVGLPTYRRHLYHAVMHRCGHCPREST